MVKGRTPAQDLARRRIEGPSAAWATIDERAFQAWGRYARERTWRNPATGAMVVPKAYTLFVGLATKARQIDPGLELSGFMPPARSFLGDGVRVAFSPLPSGGEGPGVRGPEGRDEGENVAPIGTDPHPLPSAGPLPLPPEEERPSTSDDSPLRSSSRRTLPLQEEPLGEGVVTLVASGANAPGVVTEILAQGLVNARRAVYKDKYVSQGFTAFAGADEVEVPLEVGAWAISYRFVERATGQMTGLVELGVVTVRG